MEALPGLWSLTPIGGMLGMIALFYWLLATGRLITRASHEREIAIVSKRGDEWKETALVERDGREKATALATTAVTSSTITDNFFRAHTPAEIADTLSHPRGGGNVAT